MRRLLLSLPLVLVACFTVQAQPGPVPVPITFVDTAPTGSSCATNRIYKVRSNGKEYMRISGVCALTGNGTSSGTVTSVSGTTNQINSTGGATPVLSLSNTIIAPGTLRVTTSITDDGLTATRVPFAGTGGLLGDDADLTFTGGDTLNATKILTSSVNKITITQPASGGTLTIPDGVTLNAGAGGTLGALATVTPGTGVATVLGVNIGSLGAFTLNNLAQDNAFVGNTSGIASAKSIGSCSAGSSALTYNTTTHAFGCNSISGLTSPLTTKGDVWGFSSVDARVPVGTDGQVLTADSTQTLGVKWAVATVGANTATTPILLSSTSVNLNSAATVTLYTVPPSRRAVITNVVFQKFLAAAGNAVGSTGWNGSVDDVGTFDFSAKPLGALNAAVLTNVFGSADGSVILSPQPLTGTAAQVLSFKITTPEGSAATVVVDVYGYLTDTSGIPIANVNGTGDAAAIAPASVTTTGGVGIGVAAPSAGLSLDKAVTAGGTVGAQTINKPMGSVNFAAAATSLVVTDSLVTTSSIIQCTVATNDATMKSAQCVAGSGSFTIYANAAAGAETRVNFTIFN